MNYRPKLNTESMNRILSLISVLGIFNISCYSQEIANTISSERAFMLFAKIYHINPETQIFNGGLTYYYIDYYNKKFDSKNFQQSRNDEFSYNTYLEGNKKIFTAKRDSSSLNQKYSLVYQGGFGEYSFTDSTFPIGNFKFWADWSESQGGLYNICDNDFKNSSTTFCLKLFLTESDNVNSFNENFKMDPIAAKNLIQKRKQSDGKVNRTLYLKKVFSFTTAQSKYKSPWNGVFEYYLTTHIHYIEVYEDPGLKNKLTTLYPQPSKALDVEALDKMVFDYSNAYSKYTGTYQCISGNCSPILEIEKKGQAVFLHGKNNVKDYNIVYAEVYMQSKENQDKFNGQDFRDSYLLFNLNRLTFRNDKTGKVCQFIRIK